nr:MAG TPA: hypothetical protein [Caudoviricetes sp.]
MPEKRQKRIFRLFVTVCGKQKNNDSLTFK